MLKFPQSHTVIISYLYSVCCDNKSIEGCLFVFSQASWGQSCGDSSSAGDHCWESVGAGNCRMAI